MPIIINLPNGSRVTEQQYGGAHRGGGQRGFIITQPRETNYGAFEYDITPNPHDNPDYNRERNQRDFYTTAGQAALNALIPGVGWQTPITFNWRNITYTSTGHRYP